MIVIGRPWILKRPKYVSKNLKMLRGLVLLHHICLSYYHHKVLFVKECVFVWAFGGWVGSWGKKHAKLRF